MDPKDTRLRKADEGFADACEQVNRLLARVEEQAIELHPGRFVYAPISSKDIPEIGETSDEVLALAKLEGRWRLAFGCGLFGDPPFGDESSWRWKPIAEAAMKDRLAAARVAPQFLEALVEAREEQTQEAQSIAANLREALDAFENAEGSDE